MMVMAMQRSTSSKQNWIGSGILPDYHSRTQYLVKVNLPLKRQHENFSTVVTTAGTLECDLITDSLVIIESINQSMNSKPR
mmetsp:Transcript_50043/g.121245  ORF Transcript_50043/g.121245 Transcript_50043/m.121245 type:complete len:81 (-) Transcript_50043:72-314(-)